MAMGDGEDQVHHGELEMSRMRQEIPDKLMTEAAIQEIEAQLKITRALATLNPESRGRVMNAVTHILAAEDCVHGIINTLAKGFLQ